MDNDIKDFWDPKRWKKDVDEKEIETDQRVHNIQSRGFLIRKYKAKFDEQFSEDLDPDTVIRL
jgi:hypothetical protein